MEYLIGPEGRILPSPEAAFSPRQIDSVQDAMDLLRASVERIKYFTHRIDVLGRSSRDTVITLINVDDRFGAELAEILMPGHDWQQYRDAGEVPIARGLASKDGIVGILQDVGCTAATHELLSTEELRVVIVCSDTVQVVEAHFA